MIGSDYVLEAHNIYHTTEVNRNKLKKIYLYIIVVLNNTDDAE